MTFRAVPRPRLTAVVAVTAALLLGGCASTAIDQNFQGAQRLTQSHLGAEVKWLTSDEARRQAQADVDATLAKPLTADDAVRLALAHSPALQAALFESAAASAGATQSARLPNPIFTFERLVRREGGETELDIGRMLGISVFDFLLLPSRLRMADFQQQQLQLRLASDVVQAASDARQNWVRAVAAQQSLQYFEQVKQAADASAELARRMQSVGNFNRLQRAREQAFAADAVAQLTRARQVAQSTREALVRSLGLNEAQARRLTLPERLPDLPKAPKQEADIAQQALDQRLDVRLARADLEFTARDQGLTRVTSFVNGLHVAAVRNSETGEPPQKGYELELPLPIFDFGDASRARSQATYMAALNRTAQIGVDASSQVRESYGAYRTTYDVAKHYLEEVVPLRKTIADENLLRYNGMLIGVFELLADAREQVGSVVQAIEAQRDFWLADAALQAALIGKPTGGVSMQAAPAASGGGDGGH
ncbi:TolC family protein [Caldimonas brevitalea]|uniref:Copper tolerance protein n=1 Tax=Caldimonas brevitalea TaxID=413882 RepID=A0A0G3BMR3_9BURK|nr:TolC family protein [Caldimonas brevitalea]AKJ30707.1 copper tolerance protein [Caldimonas brevitalea]